MNRFRQVGQPGATAQDHLAGAVGMQLQAGQLPSADVGLQAQHGRRCGPGRARWNPQRRELVVPGRLHRPDCASLPAGRSRLRARVTRSGLPRPPIDGRMDGDRDRSTWEDDVTDPGTAGDVPEADRAEQEALVDPPEISIAGDAQARRPTSPRPTRSTSSSSPGRTAPGDRSTRSATGRPTTPTSSSRRPTCPWRTTTWSDTPRVVQARRCPRDGQRGRQPRQSTSPRPFPDPTPVWLGCPNSIERGRHDALPVRSSTTPEPGAAVEVRPSHAERARTVATRATATVSAADVRCSRLPAHAVTDAGQFLLVVPSDGDLATAVRAAPGRPLRW